MAIFKCKMCGGTIEFEQGETVGVCDSCGTKQTLPRLDDDRKANLYDRANHFRRNNEFDKAMGIYEQILNEDATDAEAYWSLVLCKYGIEYVEDPATHRRVPTVNRAQFTSIFADEDYKSAIEHADGYQKDIYEAEAKTIDEIQKGILEISSKEEPFDVFICYKETDASGRRTPDSVLATELYHELTRDGFKVFFSRITLEDKLGQEYEPYIFAALNSAKVMVVLGTKAEHFNAVWVKNEWSRFLALIKNGERKVLIPAYKDMDPYDLPEEFSHLQAQDMSKLGFMQDLIRGIKKMVSADEQKPVVKETVINTGVANVAPLLKRAFMFLEDGEWDKADEFCEQVLNQDPENADAYLGKLMAEQKVHKQDQLADCDQPFDSSSNYQKAIRFGDSKLKTSLEGFVMAVKKREQEKAEQANRAKEKLESQVDAMARAVKGDKFGKIVLSIPDQIVKLKEEYNVLDLLLQSYDAKMIELQDFGTQRNYLKDKIKQLEEKKKSLGLFAGKEKQKIDSEINKTESDLETLTQRKTSKISEFKGFSSKQDISVKMQNISDKIANLENKVLNNLESENYDYSFLESLQLYKSDNNIRDRFKEKYPNLVSLITSMTFGQYYKSSALSIEPIEWDILDVQDNNVLLISKYVIEYGTFSFKSRSYVPSPITWETSRLRNWLNSNFYNFAFSVDEQKRIQTTAVTASNNPLYGTNPGRDTLDKVFVLSINEAKKYYRSEEERRCKATPYVASQKLISITNYGNTGWWLRTPGKKETDVAFVHFMDKDIYYDGLPNNSREGIRPALWIDLSNIN